MKKARRRRAFFMGAGCCDYAAASQYPALKGLLMRNARGDTSTSLSVGIFSPAGSVLAAAVAAALGFTSMPSRVSAFG
ncbi:hypothetical protein [Variovorax sp. 770b2]|uniref:hypothetical protein n=1 Tax=Variovorax sp. 770b2 TaxID=1566271 RepID=UPI0015A56793|nr:hypothetical protein [Variovorax sp. 770b2]